MSESTREWILKRRHEDPGEQHSQVSHLISPWQTTFDQAGCARVVTQWNGWSQLRTDASPTPSCGFTGAKSHRSQTELGDCRVVAGSLNEIEC
jgi:hypothetical protein